jgi:hypothetical protein
MLDQLATSGVSVLTRWELHFPWRIASLNLPDPTVDKGFAYGAPGEHRLRYHYLRSVGTQHKNR